MIFNQKKVGESYILKANHAYKNSSHVNVNNLTPLKEYSGNIIFSFDRDNNFLKVIYANNCAKTYLKFCDKKMIGLSAVKLIPTLFDKFSKDSQFSRITNHLRTFSRLVLRDTHRGKLDTSILFRTSPRTYVMSKAHRIGQLMRCHV